MGTYLDFGYYLYQTIVNGIDVLLIYTWIKLFDINWVCEQKANVSNITEYQHQYWEYSTGNPHKVFDGF